MLRAGSLPRQWQVPLLAVSSHLEQPELNIVESKEDLRLRAKAARRSRNVANSGSRATRSNSDGALLVAGLSRFLAEVDRGWIVTFAAMAGEPDLAALKMARPDSLALTRTPEAGFDLTVHPHDSARELHRFGFSQPVASSLVISDDEIAVVLVPGLAFDRRGGRLGFGAGYYDRFLSRLPSEVLRVGVSDGFIVDVVPTDKHDVAMTYLATDAGVTNLGEL